MPAATVERYLTRYAEEGARGYAEQIERLYQAAIVLPIFDEASDCLGSVLRHQRDADVLVIAVVNAPDNAAIGALTRTRRLLSEAQEATSLDVLLIDCVTPGKQLPAQQGVGLARKLGTDIALELYARKRLASPWIYQTDADAELPRHYFAAPTPNAGALVYAHEHVSEDTRLCRAAELYDLHMRFYVAGLQSAQSSYAYPTLGSTIAIHADSYAAVRGYPKRNAAEDFYLLNKVAKVAGVSFVQTPAVKLQARLSQRVPFGTGPALAKICKTLDQDPSGGLFLSYHPASFELLAEALTYLDAFAERPVTAPDRLAQLLTTLRFEKVRDTVTAQYPDPGRRREVLHEWFDAAKTLRFIHEARRYHPDQSLLHTLASLPETVQRHMPALETHKV